jgi:diphthine methyl ester synthase
VGLARVGHDDQQIVSGPLKDLLHVNFGAPLHTLILAGDMHFLEKEHVDLWKTSEKH